MARLLITLGLLLLVAGLLWPLIQKLGLGRLPGDLAFEWGKTRVYFPWVSSLLVSLLLSLLLWLLNR